jgi:hypothetical protein
MTVSTLVQARQIVSGVWLLATGGSLSGDLTLSSHNLITDNVSGTQIATAPTQKLGFFGASPVVREAAANDLGTVLSDLGLRAAGAAYPITTSGAVQFTGGVTITTANLTITDKDIVLSATTGTKIGTATGQKLGFYNATPIIQPIATTDLGTVLSNLGLRAAGTAYPITTSGIISFTGSMTVRAGTATAATAPIYWTTGGILLTAAVAGAQEYDAINFYMTNETTAGRGIVPVEQFFSLQASGSSITSIGNFFGTTSNIPLVSGSFYLIEVEAWFANVSGSSIVWTLTNSAAPTLMSVFFEMSPITGLVAPPGTATDLSGHAQTALAAWTFTTGTLSIANHYAHFKIWLKNNTGTSLKIQVTAAGSAVVPLQGSYWRSRRLPFAASVGAFAA